MISSAEPPLYDRRLAFGSALALLVWASPGLAASPRADAAAAPARSPGAMPTPARSPGAMPAPRRGDFDGATSSDDELDETDLPVDEPEAPAPPQPVTTGGNLLLALRPLAGNIGLADASFTGGGKPLNGGPREQVAFKGSEAGYATPFYYGAELGLHLLIEHVSLGLVGGVGRIIESNAPTATPDVTAKVDGAKAYFWSGALALGGYVWLGPALVRAEVYGGARHVAMNLNGYQATLCRTGRDPELLCSEEVSSTQPVLQPRVSLDVAILRKPGAGALVAGPWVGLDLAPARTLSAGLSLGITSFR